MTAKKIGWGVLTAIAFSSIATGFVYWRKTPSLIITALDQAESLPTRSIRPVHTAVAKPMRDMNIHEFPGKVQACRRAELAFSVSGLLEEAHAIQGRKFIKGQMLARLDQRDFQHALALAEAKYQEARKAFDRANSLRTTNAGAISRSDCEKIEAIFRVAEVNVQIGKKALLDSVLLAPFDGVVAKRYVENYESIQAKQPILSFQNLSVIEIVIQVPERFLVQEGPQNLRDLTVRFDAAPKHWRDVTIREYRMQSDPICRTYDVVLTLPQPTDIEILPGMTATVRVSIRRREGEPEQLRSGVIVPIEAVSNNGNGENFVWIIDPAGGKPRKILVEVGQLCTDGIEVLTGIQTGQHVAIAGLHSLSEDTFVRPQRQGVEGLDL